MNTTRTHSIGIIKLVKHSDLGEHYNSYISPSSAQNYTMALNFIILTILIKIAKMNSPSAVKRANHSNLRK